MIGVPTVPLSVWVSVCPSPQKFTFRFDIEWKKAKRRRLSLPLRRVNSVFVATFKVKRDAANEVKVAASPCITHELSWGVLNYIPATALNIIHRMWVNGMPYRISYFVYLLFGFQGSCVSQSLTYLLSGIIIIPATLFR